MEWPIKIDLGTGCLIDASISLFARNGDVFMEFLDSEKETLIIDTLSSFQAIEFNEFNSLHLIFKGESTLRSFQFLNETSLSNSFEFFQNFIKLKPLMLGKKKIFNIIPKNKKIIKSKETVRSTSQPIVSKLVFSNTTTENISSGLIRESLSDFEMIIINELNFENFYENSFFKKSVKTFELTFDQSFIVDLWIKLFNIKDKINNNLKNYELLYLQWNPIHILQIENSKNLQNYILEIEKIIDSMILSWNFSKKMIFDILLCYFVENNYKINFTLSFIDILLFFINNFITNHSSHDEILCQNGDKLTYFETSNIIYHLFKEVISLPIIDIINLYDDTSQLLLLASPSTYGLFNDYEINDFSFLNIYINSYFINGRDIEDSILLFTSIISYPSRYLFIKCLIAASFILLQNRLKTIPLSQKKLFLDVFIGLFRSINIRLLLFNTHLMLEFENDR